MRILLTQRKLGGFAGTEMITLELACALKRRGHEVGVYCPRPGKVSDLLAANGVPTYAQIDDIPWRPNIIHAHHQLPAMAALAAFEDVPAIYACHGLRPWVERPPLHPQIKTYVVVSEKMAAYVATTSAIPEKRIVIVRNFVDTNRFSTVSEQPVESPKKAVLFGQGFKPEEVRRLEDACEANALSLDKIGYAYGNMRTNPELFLPDYDIAFAIGRSAIEAMACGCATIPIMPHLAGEIVTPGNFNDWVEKNFSPRYFTSADRISSAWLAEQLAVWEPRNVEEVTNRIRREFTLEATIDQFESLYGHAVDQPSAKGAREASVAYLEKLAVEVDENWQAMQGAERARARQAALLKDQTNALRETQKQVDVLAACILSTPGGVVSNVGNNDWIAAIEANGLFDREWYLATNQDVAESGIDPFVHYINYGAEEGRDPSPAFDSISNNRHDPHLYEAGLSLMQHTARQLMAVAQSSQPKRQRHWKNGVLTFTRSWTALLRMRDRKKR